MEEKGREAEMDSTLDYFSLLGVSQDASQGEIEARYRELTDHLASSAIPATLRDWADRVGRLGIALWWGPGRHGPGNNLFFMIEDPDGHKVELSAELELMPKEMAWRTWPHEQRTLNLWGSAWMRS